MKLNEVKLLIEAYTWMSLAGKLFDAKKKYTKSNWIKLYDKLVLKPLFEVVNNDDSKLSLIYLKGYHVGTYNPDINMLFYDNDTLHQLPNKDEFIDLI